MGKCRNNNHQIEVNELSQIQGHMCWHDEKYIRQMNSLNKCQNWETWRFVLLPQISHKVEIKKNVSILVSEEGRDGWCWDA